MTGAGVVAARWRRWWIALPLAIAAGLLALRAGLHTPPLDRLRAAAPAAAEPGDPPGTIARAGSIFVARGGPVIIGVDSPGEARLQFAGQTLRGSGLVTRRVVVARGAAAIRLAAPDGARLVWSPVGRRGDPEYVPASSLSPDPPDRARFTAPGTARLDGAVALGLLLCAIAAALGAARGRLARVPRPVWVATALVLAVGLAVRWFDLGGAGQTWDEDVNWAAGRNYITNLVGLDFTARSWRWNFEHPPVMKLLAGIAAQFTDGFGPARALSAIASALGCALLVPIGARLFRLRVGVLAGAIAALLPPLVAHGQIVGHESPSVLWWALAVVLALGVHDELPADRPVRALVIRLAAVGVAIGIAIASRFIGGLVGPVCAAIVVVQAPPGWRIRTAIAGALVMPLAAAATVYAVWPRLWQGPLAALDASYGKLEILHAPEPFLGAVTAAPGAHYFVVYLAATLPLAIAVTVALGAVQLVRARNRGALIVACWLAAPLAVVLSPVRQDGVRYVLPCLLALALIAAVGLDQLAGWLRARRAFAAVAAAIVVYLTVTLVRSHPYYLDYFGEQVGGAGAVAERGWFETAWWGEGLDRAVDHVNVHAAAGARVDRSCVEPSHLTWFREDLWAAMARGPDQADWIVVYAPARRPCRLPRDARRVFAVTADGAVLAAVYRRP